MADVEESSNSTTGIKLFGATIMLKKRSPENDEERTKRDDGGADEKRPPEKIIPCPRCKSMETKFCYFNNYNVNQPRHFCKGCQRYWTAGGALRNVPVGAGRRKNKPPLSDGCISAVQHLAFDHGQFFPAKRRRCASDSQGF